MCLCWGNKSVGACAWDGMGRDGMGWGGSRQRAQRARASKYIFGGQGRAELGWVGLGGEGEGTSLPYCPGSNTGQPPPASRRAPPDLLISNPFSFSAPFFFQLEFEFEFCSELAARARVANCVQGGKRRTTARRPRARRRRAWKATAWGMAGTMTPAASAGQPSARGGDDCRHRQAGKRGAHAGAMALGPRDFEVHSKTRRGGRGGSGCLCIKAHTN